MTDQERFDALCGVISVMIPGFEIRYKDESWSSKAIAVLVWPFNRNYLSDYVTTIYPRVYFPSRDWVRRNLRTATKILAHEFVHLMDQRDLEPFGFLFPVAYLGPQVLAVLALFGLFGFVSPFGLFGLLPLLFLAPWPSLGRTKKEVRGYAMSLIVNEWAHGSILESSFGWVVEQFVGSSYYFMWWSRPGVRERIEQQLDAIRKGTGGHVYPLVQRIFQEV